MNNFLYLFSTGFRPKNSMSEQSFPFSFFSPFFYSCGEFLNLFPTTALPSIPLFLSSSFLFSFSLILLLGYNHPPPKLEFYFEAHVLMKFIIDMPESVLCLVGRVWWFLFLFFFSFFSETFYWLSELKQFRLHIKYALFTQALHTLHTVTALEELVSDK